MVGRNLAGWGLNRNPHRPARAQRSAEVRQRPWRSGSHARRWPRAGSFRMQRRHATQASESPRKFHIEHGFDAMKAWRQVQQSDLEATGRW